MTLAITLAARSLPAVASIGGSVSRMVEARQQTLRLARHLEARHAQVAARCAQAALLSESFTDHQAALLEALAQVREPALRAQLLDALEALSAQEEGGFRELFGR